ncbi:MAG: EAL domain-containing protein [Gammaproteobacteria bacterium]|nr:EAL domain-containing protein [Gammaproteobacteria bacterium]
MVQRTSRLDLVIAILLVAFAIAAGIYVQQVANRFESDLALQAGSRNHDVGRIVASLSSLEDDLRGLSFGNRQQNMQVVQSSFLKSRALVEEISRTYDFHTEVPQTQALEIAHPLMQDLSVWLESGIANQAATSATVQRIASQRVYLARTQLEKIYEQANMQTLDLIKNQSRQVRSFSNTVILLMASLLVLLIFARFLYARNRQAQARLWHQRKLVTDSINNINEGFILTDRTGMARVINTAMPRMCQSLAKQLEDNIPYSVAIDAAVEAGVLNRLRSRQVAATDSADTGNSEGTATRGEQTEYRTDTGLYLRVTERDTQDGGRVVTFTDITDLKNTEDKLQRQANYDYLTGIANRSYYVERLTESLARARRHSHKVALMQFDLDRFKQVNDTLGHAVGDELLVQTASRIKRNLREIDLAARTGGDEFVAIIDQINDEEEAIASAERIANELRQELVIDGIHVDFSASIGIAVYPDHARDIEALMQHADIACYRAKDSGRNNYQLYGTDMKVQAMELVTLETRLRRAIEQNELYVDYQPHMNVATGELSGVEAFSRWHDEKLGNVSPDQFIPVADKNGLITKLGEQVLEKVFAQLQAWQQHGLEGIQVAINISQRQLFQPNLTEVIDSCAERYGVDPGCILMEITENVINDEGESATQRLMALAERNIKFVLDDYGKGASSLIRIKNLPIKALKIDGDFIRNIVTDSATREIVGAMISSATNLHLDTIAECVESEEQMSLLREMGCTIVQGYYVGAPQTADDIERSYTVHDPLQQAKRRA